MKIKVKGIGIGGLRCYCCNDYGNTKKAKSASARTVRRLNKVEINKQFHELTILNSLHNWTVLNAGRLFDELSKEHKGF